MLITCHTNNMIYTGKQNIDNEGDIIKPNYIIKYNENMGSVDKTDMLLSSVECFRKKVKWYKKFFFI